MDVFLMLLVITALGVISKNATVWMAGLGLLALRLWPGDQPLAWTEQYGLKIGVIILTMGVLSPIALGKIPWSHLVDTIKSVPGLAAVAVGMFVAYLGGRGAGLLTDQPTIVTGLLIGTIIGVALFRGVPVGPLIAAGILSLFAHWLR
ncbi:uncharacterized membrane protein (DUF441 family) [Melghirimyces profundicolus]|uniref:UPF0756 membrane protein C8P63_1476 n=1 Tax=Melghirimyces profundicolus TaxID=1242148 RepID=A0A2T6AWE5_9BACL|nr:DUF441 domain-containing protein [Melghirimyces profundicolus]PTX48134.1 uncharacterized membrane protein (DUF441 family) [Melghirimyces profundicolus]